ncbi:hypothetical protein FB45DRAFT_1055535 [Roridomyces roridus]|uniref:Uncharacterized protein n=1 Tax=Roridomyces roridus TaxID=1738132 RepID=A0AAD7FRV2_9AGAR|nr:hypothetical protein FB45DRAFT_1055535 [Roridomyces roridus]
MAARRTHRKRVSMRLSSDTTATLPQYEYWRDVVPPPEYEADDDNTDDDDDDDTKSRPHTSPPLSPRPYPRRPHRRHTSSPLPQDTFLDSLLERSVHALELSNALLQSSMTPTSSTFREPSPTAPISMPPPREPWAEDLAAIERDVDELLVSSSLPTPSSTIRAPRRRPSLEPIPSASYSPPSGLHMAPPLRTRLVSHAPRALTQYIDATDGSADDDTISLPSTLGLRAPSSDWRGVHGPHGPILEFTNDSRGNSIDWRRAGLPVDSRPAESSRHVGIPSDWRTPIPAPGIASPALSSRSPEPATAAYNLLSAFVRGEQHPTQSPPRVSSPRSPSRGRSSPRGLSINVGSRSSSRGTATGSTVTAGAYTPRRAMTPPIEIDVESPTPENSEVRPGLMKHPNGSTISQVLPSPMHTPTSSENDDDDEGEGRCRAKAARSALRKILDEAPPPPPPPPRPKREFHPRSPPPAPTAGSSTATASVSRLFTRGGRHSVSRGEERVVGIMKGTRTNTPIATTPTTPATPTMLTPSWSFFGGSGQAGGSSSGTSTPSGKRISFAELPESYAGSRESSGAFNKRKKTRRGSGSGKGKGKGKAREGSEDDAYGAREGGWLSWLLPAPYDVGERVGGTGERRSSGVWGVSIGGAGGMGVGRGAGDEWSV